ncbi:MAG: class I SAM-dependent methyltransferase [Solirubrobacteraceae bacterium]|jgi:demethylmenaquinone methyltransferase/2-methoxy-6-polyprenyl-1,4-benzoquinol methylase
MARSTFVRQPLPQVTRRYDRMARWYRAAEITILLPHRLRKKAVQRLDLKPGETVLEIGCGTGRNLPLLCEAVGNDGHVLGVDASSGMLARAQQWATHHHRQNVHLLHQDAAELALPGQVDAALFSLSYSALPDREPVLQKTWEALRPRGRLVIMDAGLPASPLGRLLGPIGEAIATIFPGDPYSRPWEDLTRLSQSVQSEWFQLGIYFICTIRKPATSQNMSSSTAT